MNKRANPISTFYYLINSLVMIICMDKIEKYIRLNMGFEVVDGSFEKIEKNIWIVLRIMGYLKIFITILSIEKI